MYHTLLNTIRLNQFLGLFTFLGLSSYINTTSYCAFSLKNFFKSSFGGEVSGAGQRKVVAQSSDYGAFRASSLEERFTKQESRCDGLWARVETLEGKSREVVQAQALECTKLQNDNKYGIKSYQNNYSIRGTGRF